MAARRDDLQPPQILRAHRPRTSDAVDVQEEEFITEELPKPRRRFGWFWKYLLIGMVVLFGFYLLLSRFVLPFVMQTEEHWDYGASRVSVTDLKVGHNGLSHFVSEYYRNQIIIVEIPVAHPEQARAYSLPITLTDTASHVITLTAAYISHDDKPGKPDLLITVSGFAIPLVLYNTGDAFSTGA